MQRLVHERAGSEWAEWYAVDADGLVGRFDAAPGGAIPCAAALSDHELRGIEEALDLYHREGSYHSSWVQPADTGSELIAEPYVPEPIPGMDPEEADDLGPPLRLDQLPAGLQDLIGRVRFTSVRFREATAIQPALLTRCYLPEGGYRDLAGLVVPR